MKKIICPSCGASFNESEPKCPYCGTVYEPGAEKEYKEKLNDLRMDLDIVDNLAEDDYKSDFKAFLERFLPIVGTVLFIAVVALTVYKISTSGSRSANRVEMDESIQKLSDLRTYEEVFDAYYDAGDYAGMLEEIDAWKEECGGRFGSDSELVNWRNYDFYYCLTLYENAEEAVEDYIYVMESSSLPTTSRYADVLYYGFRFYGTASDEDNGYRLLAGEREYLNTLCSGLEEEMRAVLQISEEEYEALKTEVFDGRSYPSFDTCEEFARKKTGGDR